LYVQTITILLLFYVRKKEVVERIALILSVSFILYLLHLLVTLPFSLLSLSTDMSFAKLQKSTLTAIRIILTLELYVIIIFFIRYLLAYHQLKISKDFIYLLLILIVATITPVNYFRVKLIYLLNSFLPLLFILFILTHILYLNKKIKFGFIFTTYINTSFYILVFWALLGYTYGLILYIDNWKFFDIATFYTLKGHEPINGLPISWWIPIGDTLFFRFPSIFENPITAGYFSAFFSMTLFFLRKNLLATLFFIFTLMSVSKGAILFLLLFMIVLLISNTKTIIRTLLLKILNSPIVLLILLIGYLFLQYLVSIFFHTSATIHMLGLTLPFNNIFQYSIYEVLFGHGIGSGGNFHAAASGESLEEITWLTRGAESGIGTIFYQLGFSGLALILSISYKLVFIFQTIESRFIYFFYFLNIFMQENLINQNLLILVFLSILIIEFNKHIKDFR
jgi:hypothetical protein